MLVRGVVLVVLACRAVELASVELDAGALKHGHAEAEGEEFDLNGQKRREQVGARRRS